MLKHFHNNSVILDLIINKGAMVLTGDNYYFWVSLKDKFEVNYMAICILMAILIIKTEVTFGAKGRFAAPTYIVPGLLIYFVVFPKGII
jgi:hypothetical protein